MNQKPKLEWVHRDDAYSARVECEDLCLLATCLPGVNSPKWVVWEIIGQIDLCQKVGTAPTFLEAQLAAEDALKKEINDMITKLTEIRGRLG